MGDEEWSMFGPAIGCASSGSINAVVLLVAVSSEDFDVMRKEVLMRSGQQMRVYI